jgi:hypothetical protein
MYCTHDKVAHGELVLRPFHMRIRCERCGQVIKMLESDPLIRHAAKEEMREIRELDPSEPVEPATVHIPNT